MTMFEELENINKLVTNEEQARRASIIKWTSAEKLLARLGSMIGRQCGFCALGVHRALEAEKFRGARCDFCPSDVKVFCKTLDETIPDRINALYESICLVLDFLNEDFKVTDGSEEKTDV